MVYCSIEILCVKNLHVISQLQDGLAFIAELNLWRSDSAYSDVIAILDSLTFPALNLDEMSTMTSLAVKLNDAGAYKVLRSSEYTITWSHCEGIIPDLYDRGTKMIRIPSFIVHPH